MTPLHRHSTPAMAMHSCTAAPAPSSAAAPTASMVPFHAAKISDTAAIPVQIQAIAINNSPFRSMYMAGKRIFMREEFAKMSRTLLT